MTSMLMDQRMRKLYFHTFFKEVGQWVSCWWTSVWESHFPIRWTLDVIHQAALSPLNAGDCVPQLQIQVGIDPSASVTLMTSFVIAFSGYTSLGEFNSKMCTLVYCSLLGFVPSYIYLNTFMTQLWLNECLNSIQLMPTIGCTLTTQTSSLNKPSPLLDHYHGTDYQKMLGHFCCFQVFETVIMEQITWRC